MSSTTIPLIHDGAMGTELTRRGFDTHLPLWSAKALIDTPSAVQQIHADYLAAGAQVITTNTFRTNRRALAKANMAEQARALTFRAVQLAKQACHDYMQIQPMSIAPRIAGSIAPVEDCYMPELVPSENELDDEHTELAHNLADAGCDFILIETMNCIREALCAVKAAFATGLPFWVSFTLNAHNDLLSGETLREAVSVIAPFNPQAMLVNCIPVAQCSSALHVLRNAARSAHISVRFGVYGNVGHVDDEVGWTLTHAVSPQMYATHARAWANDGADIIGGCCGTMPAHINAIVNEFRGDAKRQTSD